MSSLPSWAGKLDYPGLRRTLVAHDPKKAPLAANVRVTEDANEIKPGEGFWKTASELRPFRTDFLDPQTGTAGVHAVIEKDGTVLLWMDFGAGSLPRGDGKALVTFEAFKVYGGEVHAVEAMFKGMPADTPPGWK